MTSSERTTQDLHSYLAVLSRRKWVILAFAIIVPVVAFLYSSSEDPVYEATSDVLTRTAQGVTGIDDPGIFDPQRAADTQVQLARVPAVAALTLEAVGLENRSADDLLDSSSVEASPNSDIMTFKVRDGDPDVAANLATEYARAVHQVPQRARDGRAHEGATCRREPDRRG